MKRAWLLLLLASACGDEATRPAPLPSAAPVPQGESPFTPPKRSVETRTPWGGPAGNLLVDGDFEHSIGFESAPQQTGWIAFSNGGQLGMRGETGGICKSGLQCAVLPPNVLLFGKGVAAAGVGMSATLWAKPPMGKGCDVVQPYLVRCSLDGVGVDLVSEAAFPGMDGWCLYRAALPAQKAGTCLVVESTLAGEETALVDDARMFPNDGTGPEVPAAGMAPLPGGLAARAHALGEHLRKGRRFGRTPPSPLDRIGAR